MAALIHLKTFTDARGSLSVIENEVGFPIRRIFYLHHITSGESRARHRHKTTKQALIAVNGSCKLYCNDGRTEQTLVLDDPALCFLAEPEDWLELYDFSENAVLLVLASEPFDPDDYIHEPYPQASR